MKAPHYELQLQYLLDITQTVWIRNDLQSAWLQVRAATPSWNPSCQYHIGPTPPEQPKMCELGSLQFPSPESVAPEIGVDCWIAHVTGPVRFQWTNFDIDNQILKAGFVHLNEKASEQHSAALCADNLQAVENAR